MVKNTLKDFSLVVQRVQRCRHLLQPFIEPLLLCPAFQPKPPAVSVRRRLGELAPVAVHGPVAAEGKAAAALGAGAGKALARARGGVVERAAAEAFGD